MTLEERIAHLEVENAALREQLAAALAEIRELKGQLAKDSHNSSKPPSSDGLARKPKSLRHKSGKKPGGQPGHPGHQVRLVETPDAVVLHRPTLCGDCQYPLPNDAPAWIERRQVHELPPVRLVVTEHQICHVRCPACEATTEAAAPADQLSPLHRLPPCPVQRSSPARVDLRGGRAGPGVGRRPQGAAARDAHRRRPGPCGRRRPAEAGGTR